MSGIHSLRQDTVWCSHLMQPVIFLQDSIRSLILIYIKVTHRISMLFRFMEHQPYLMWSFLMILRCLL